MEQEIYNTLQLLYENSNVIIQKQEDIIVFLQFLLGFIMGLLILEKIINIIKVFIRGE